ncbi:MAG: Co2+/Mg2+ efflux protein ApaG [Rhizobiaceae bacterium]
MFEALTNNVLVTAMPVYIDERSEPEDSQYFWAYRISIENKNPVSVQLLSRYWQIVDAIGHVEEVRGEGVIGEQPVIGAGETYEYTSGCPLSTPSGFMSGKYQMIDEDGLEFEADIPSFPLDLPDIKPILN